MSSPQADDNSAPPLPHEHIIFTDLDGEAGVLVDLNTKKYYQLNETASLVWRGLERRTSLAGIGTQLTERYDVTIDHAVASVARVVQSFAELKLLKPT